MHFKLFANCIPVKGFTRSIICDLQRRDYEFIPNSLYELLTYCGDYSVEEIKQNYSESESIIEEYFDFLIKKEYGFFCSRDEIKLFPKLDTAYHNPSKITNAILDFDTDSTYDLSKIISELDQLGCKAVQLRFFDVMPIESIKSILAKFFDCKIRHIDLLVKYDEAQTSADMWENILQEHPRVVFVVIYNSPVDSTLEFSKIFTNVNFTTGRFESEACCGVISPAYFSSNFSLFIESQQFNTCLNKKISIDRRGNVKNCPSMKATFGLSNSTALRDVVSEPAFRKYWNVKKDDIEVCRDCEFRHICTDCRAHIEEGSGNVFLKPSKCTYDPYQAIWVDPLGGE